MHIDGGKELVALESEPDRLGGGERDEHEVDGGLEEGSKRELERLSAGQEGGCLPRS
jgi:hypothetical protein